MDPCLALLVLRSNGTRSIIFSCCDAECYIDEADVEGKWLAMFVQAVVRIRTDRQVVNSVS